MVTVLTDAGPTNIPDAETSGDALWLSKDAVETATGWTLRPEGFCQGDVCVPIPGDKSSGLVRDDTVNVAGFWEMMNRPVLRDAAGETWMLGSSADDRASALSTLEAPDFTLPDLDGNMHSLSDYRGKRVFLMTWSSW